MTELLQANSFEILPHLLSLLVAYALAFPIGWNREREERSAGLRTFPLVAVATCGVVQAAESSMPATPEAMARIIEGLITGMGFIGGGAILRMKDSVRGTATAASLWITGAIGISVGLGSYDVAILLAAATVITLWLLSPLKKLGQSASNLTEPDDRAAADANADKPKEERQQ
ncbi:MgtC/SapB family protein [Sphingomonas piscis]|uniref:Protein MgtC n=1 Tax=Sphingomonas piscis TaxID=2714943 RepID=A0A6G7YN62_9SPHN|nr:MgtC/SapB family protein [Sphingomonas piscis]QIK78183.1 MgtC/SapB family protein [Sphingomonas piscis]